MKGRVVRSPEPQCLVVGRKGRTGEAAQAAGWGRTWRHLLFSPHPCATELRNRLLQDTRTEVSVGQRASVSGRRVHPGERRTRPMA